MARTSRTARADESELSGEKTPFGAGKIKELHKAGLDAVRASTWQYWLNYAFMQGEQWLYSDPVRNTIAELPRDPDRVRVTVNKIWPSSRTIISKLTSRPLQFVVPPSAADDATIHAAHLAESILAAVKKDHDWEGIREDNFWGTWKGGTAAICVDWDPEAGTPIGTDPTDLSDPNHNLGTGDTVESALTIADFVVQPGVRDARRAQWWIKSVALPPEIVQEQYDLPKKPAADATAALTPYQSKLLAAHSNVGSDDTDADLTQVWTYYERPSKKNPAGKVCVVVGEKIVDESPWPFPFKDRLNLTIVRETRLENKWLGETVVTVARPVQTALNQSWSSIVEHMKQCGNARLFVPQAAMDIADQMTDAPGEVIPYIDGATLPEWKSPPTMPQWWIMQPEKLGAELDDILGIHDVSRGAAPVNIQSGYGLSILAEMDTTPIGRMTKESAAAWSEVATMVLEIYSEKVTETRQAVVMSGGGQAPTTVKWTGQDLLYQTRATVPPDSVMPRSKAQQMEFATQAMEMGLITSLEQFVRLSEMPESVDLLESLSPDVAKARRENYLLSTEKPIVPAVFDDHAIHHQEHLVFMKSPRWDSISDEARKLFIMHDQGHSTMSAEQLGDAAAKASVNPLLAAAVPTDSRPVLPVGELPPPGAMPAGGGDPATDPNFPPESTPSMAAAQSKLMSRSLGPVMGE